jgi:hypothetical protein
MTAFKFDAKTGGHVNRNRLILFWCGGETRTRKRLPSADFEGVSPVIHSIIPIALDEVGM